ncbi:MAG: hypothetical protein MZV65_30765 [Chromatiales bacterium]|nr:hypothetical protein [Chromatiales bacterium]
MAASCAPALGLVQDETVPARSVLAVPATATAYSAPANANPPIQGSGRELLKRFAPRRAGEWPR